MSPKLIVLGNSTLAGYMQGGGHWSVYLQYLFGLKALGHKVILLELYYSGGDNDYENKINLFLDKMKSYGLEDDCAVLFFKKNYNVLSIDEATAYGKSMDAIKMGIHKQQYNLQQLF